MGASLCAGRQAFPDEHDGHPAYVQNAVYGQHSYANHASADVRQKPLGGRESSYAASRFEAGQSRRVDVNRNARPRGEERPPRANRDLRVDIPPSIPANLTTPPSASTPQTPAEDDYFNSVDEAPVFHENGDSADDLQRMIEGVGPPQDTLEPIRWAKGQLIGAGAFGRVYMGMNLDSGELLAVKQVLLATNNTSKEKIQEHLKGLEAEVAVLRNLSHPNIVRYLGTDREEECLNIFLEFVPGGSIASLLSKFGSFKETVIRRYTCQLLLGLEYLHNHQIMHRDIKGANILVDNKGVIKLADFGASKKLADLATMSEGFRSMKGTPYWMAPEVIKQTGHGRQADIWSVGCTVIEMATGKPPWSQFSSGVSALFHIASSKGPPPIPENLSADGRDFLLKCFRRDPKERPSATELLRHPFIAEAGLERSSISPSLASSTFLPSVPSQQTPVLTSGTLTSAGGRTPSYAPAWNKRPATPPTAPLPPSTSYDDDSMRQGSVVSSLPPQSLNRNQASLAYENQLGPIGEDQSASRGEYSPGESGGGTRDGESFRDGGRQNGHRSEEEEEARGMVQFPTGLGVGDYNNLSMMNSFNPMEEPTIAGDVNIVHWDNSLSEDENLVSAEVRRQLAGGPVSNEGTPGASASNADPPKSRAHSRQSSREREEERKSVRSKTEEAYVNREERGDEGYRGRTGRLVEGEELRTGRLDEGYRSKSGRLDDGRAGKAEEAYGGKGGKLEEGYGAKSGRLDEGYGGKSERLEEGSKGRSEKEDLGTEEVVNEETLMAFLDEQAQKFKELIVPLEEQANSSLRYSDASDERSGEETDGYGATSVQQEAYSGSPSREDDSYAPPDEEGRNGYPDSGGGEFYGRGNNGYSQADSYSSPRGNGYSPQPADPYASPRVNGYPPDPYRDSYDAPPRSFRGTPRGQETYARTPVPRVPQTEPRTRANAGGCVVPAEGGPSPLIARARGARSFREGGSGGGTSGSSGARSSRDGSDVSVVPVGVKRATSFLEGGASRADLDLGRPPQPFLTESLKDVPLSKEEQWKQELARELDSVRVKDHYRRSVARQSDDRGSPMSYGGSPYGTRDSSFMRQSSRLGQPVIPR